MCVYYMYMCVHTYVYERDVDRSVDCTCVCTHTHKEIYFMELGHMIMEAGKSTVCRIGWRPREESQFKCKDSLLTKFLLALWRSVFFFLLRPSAHWTRPSHIIEGTLLYQSLLITMLISSRNYLHRDICNDV